MCLPYMCKSVSESSQSVQSQSNFFFPPHKPCRFFSIVSLFKLHFIFARSPLILSQLCIYYKVLDNSSNLRSPQQKFVKMPAAIRGGHVDTWEDSKVVPSSHLKLCTETDNCPGDYKHARARARTHTHTHTHHSLLNICTLARTRRKRCCGQGREGSK